LGLVSPADLALALAQWLFCRLLLKFLSFSFFSSFLSSLVFLIQLDSTELRAFSTVTMIPLSQKA
jgi:hypothetical protein